MILGTGIDIIEIARIEELILRHGNHFLKKIYTAEEKDYCQPKALAAQHYAARFAAKEAAMKALGTGWQKGIGFLSIEVFREGLGRPSLRFHGNALQASLELGVAHIHLSLSHSREHAIAQVILEGS